MTLLKLLYFAHGWHLAEYDAPLVGQPFEAWKYGPVNRVVYDQLKGQGRKTINCRLKVFSIEALDFVEASCELDEPREQLLISAFDYFTQYHAFALSEITHTEGSPWDRIWSAAEEHAVAGMIIPDQLIKNWFQAEGKLNGRNSH
ncbi:MAG: DUF4065 domain-containing protein [Beijerinckiaceae bacterium]|nr:DUF4065 domain-containing protein [Beijerinckiaceae bacterium]